MENRYDVVVIGGGAAGLMCAVEAGKRGRKTLLIEHCSKVGKKILISGGGRCNFTNLTAGPHAYRSENPHFCKSALARFTQEDFIELVRKHEIDFYEKKLGQLFCKGSAREIITMMLSQCDQAGVEIKRDCSVEGINKLELFELSTTHGAVSAESLVIATGGLSIPKMGATGFGYDVAKQFGLKLTARQAALVPFVFESKYLENFKDLSGLSIDAELSCNGGSFRENILITHKGISGPAVLQISSYWKEGDSVVLNLLPDLNLPELIEEQKLINGKTEIKNLLYNYLPRRFVQRVFEVWLKGKTLGELNTKEIGEMAAFFHSWEIWPKATEGYRTAEVTLGGVDTGEISSKTFEAKKAPGLYFIGEVLDVTGWLGGYNFQWAWSSGFCAGQYV